jgi:hypothetical protein
MAPAGLNFGAGPSYAAGMSSASAGHDEDVPDFSSLLAVSLQDPVSSSSASVVIVIDYLNVVKSFRCSELVVAVDNL